MVAFLIPILLPMISTTGAMELVVQLAQDTIRTESSPSVLTPWTTVPMSSLLAGADRRTNLAPAWRCFSRPSFLVKTPVHSKTKSIPSSPQGSRAGSFSLKTLYLVPSTIRASLSCSTVLSYLPYTVSYLSR